MRQLRKQRAYRYVQQQPSAHRYHPPPSPHAANTFSLCVANYFQADLQATAKVTCSTLLINVTHFPPSPQLTHTHCTPCAYRTS